MVGSFVREGEEVVAAPKHLRVSGYLHQLHVLAVVVVRRSPRAGLRQFLGGVLGELVLVELLDGVLGAVEVLFVGLGFVEPRLLLEHVNRFLLLGRWDLLHTIIFFSRLSTIKFSRILESLNLFLLGIKPFIKCSLYSLFIFWNWFTIFFNLNFLLIFIIGLMHKMLIIRIIIISICTPPLRLWLSGQNLRVILNWIVL